ncbi:sensor histidine kinase [Leekyejoonella antrihumi]|uniref:histidine kinase n=1 Tax=Leekyejoonella antrihumi TaxID=1660198 RepID=A0A563E7W8_9MICO|nr:ATP-binding protein [Leekyejoonella antrihumi]TWP38607.1 HAMP domain-containing protein [Leekyejoonella antrihumi]
MVLAAGLLVWRLHSSLVANLDARVTQQAQTIAADAARDKLPHTIPGSGDSAPTVQVVDASGHVVAASANLDHPGVRMFTVAGRPRGTRVITVTNGAGDADDGPYRVAVLSAHGPGGPVTVYAGLPTAGVEESIGELGTALTVGVPFLVLALVLVGWLLIGLALRPVEAIRRQAAAIPGTQPSDRLDSSGPQDELGRLAATFNDLLARIEEATSRQRQFVADAAHELRSPIAALQAQLEVAARHPELARATATTAGMLTDTERLAHLVDDLLALARLDANRRLQRQVVDLDDLVLQEVRRAQRRGVTVQAGQVSAGQVLGDPAGLDRVVRNLLDNAVRHAASGVTVALGAKDEVVTLIVADDGPGIATADRERIFERFTRLDDARSRDAGGAGLGLAIVRDVVAAHGGQVRIQDNHPGARFTVTLPATPP